LEEYEKNKKLKLEQIHQQYDTKKKEVMEKKIKSETRKLVKSRANSRANSRGSSINSRLSSSILKAKQ
jgi:hypothetical protein